MGHRFVRSVSYFAVTAVVAATFVGFSLPTPSAPAGADGATVIMSWTELAGIEMDGNYVLGRDLSSADEDYEGTGDSWTPLGTYGDPFTGTFDGDGHTISDLIIDNPDADAQGLFGRTEHAAIKNVGVLNVEITANNQVGALAGIMEYGYVLNCYSTGAVNGSWSIGGLVGANYYGVITLCNSSVNVTSDNFSVGGLVGESNNDGAVVSYSFATGDVSAGIGYCGGLLGNGNGGKVHDCYATGNVTSLSYGPAGGLAGAQEPWVTNCYSTGSVNGAGSTGGLIGAVYSSQAVVKSCYAVGDVVSSGYIGGLVGESVERVKYENCWYIKNGATRGVGNRSPDPVGVNHEASDDPAAFHGSVHAVYTGWDFVNVWEENVGDFPGLRTDIEPELPVTVRGTVSIDGVPASESITVMAFDLDDPVIVSDAPLPPGGPPLLKPNRTTNTSGGTYFLGNLTRGHTYRLLSTDPDHVKPTWYGNVSRSGESTAIKPTENMTGVDFDCPAADGTYIKGKTENCPEGTAYAFAVVCDPDMWVQMGAMAGMPNEPYDLMVDADLYADQEYRLLFAAVADEEILALGWYDGLAWDEYELADPVRGNATNIDYDFSAVPAIKAVSPTSGPVGTTVTIDGRKFGSARGSSHVTFGSKNAVTYPSWSNTQIKAEVPSGVSGEVDLTVTTGGGKSNAKRFTVTVPPAPVPVPAISSVSPTRGQVGTTVTINGGDFGSARGSSYVGFGNKKAVTYPSWSNTQIKAKVPSGVSGEVDVTVTTGGGTSNAKRFTVTAAGPTITSVSPAYAAHGDTVTIKGSGFGMPRGSGKGVAGKAASYVTFGGIKARDYPEWTDTRIKAVVPPGATTGSVRVVTPRGSSNTDRTLTVYYPTWYLAEGSTDWGFDTYITIMNPNSTAVTVDITYMTDKGPRERPGLALPPESQTTMNPRGDLGAADFSTRVKCTTRGKSIAADRTMYWTGDGAPCEEAHCSVGVTSPARTWYLPEGSSSWGFECFLLIQNPNESTATCRVTYMIEGVGPRTVIKKVAANSRETFNMADDLADIGIKDASIKVESDVPVIPERAMYRNNRREGHVSVGTTEASTDYFLAEGATGYGSGFITYVLVQNPNADPVDVDITYMTAGGPVPFPTFTMYPGTRKTIRVNDFLPPDTDFSTHVHGSAPIIAERAMYWRGGPDSAEVCHDSIGMSRPLRAFYLPDGQTSNGRETWTLVANPNDADVKVRISYLNPSGQGNVSFEEDIPKRSRRTFSMTDKGINGRAAVLVECLTSGKKIMCERAMYWNQRGAGTNTIGGFGD